MAAEPVYWRFILHGGCAESYPDQDRQREISENLRVVGETVASALARGANAKDVVVEAVSSLEDCPLYNAGLGSALSRRGTHQLEAGIVDGSSGGYGAVGCTMTTKNPILVANALLESGPHTMLVGRAADNLAKDLGFDVVSNDFFTTAFRLAHWKKQPAFPEMGTVGAVVLDADGRLAAGGSTGGPTAKWEGRIGDTAILGAGLYADGNLAVMCSGAGDQIFKSLIASKVAHYHASGLSISEAARQALTGASMAGASCAVAVIDAEGNSAIEPTARVFHTVWGSSSGPLAFTPSPSTLPVLPQHIIYEDDRLLIGLSRHPSTPGHTLVVLKQPDANLFSLRRADFVGVLLKASTLASTLGKYYEVRRCALVTEGDRTLSILPLHGLSESWVSVTSDLKEFHRSYPGYITSKDGPQMARDKLDEICTKIQTVSGISEPFNYYFDGDATNNNLFARIVKGELPQWRVWEDDHHVAFLTPFANSPGFTVLVPRKHLSSDIFSIDKEPYSNLVGAAHIVARILEDTFGIPRCGMIFEGLEIDYAHVKLIPIHEADLRDGITVKDRGTASFHENYQGYVSSLHGPLSGDLKLVTTDAFNIRRLFPVEAVRPPRSWGSPSRHLTSVIRDPWYRKLFSTQDALMHSTTNFFQKKLQYKHCFVPVTTDAVTSPIGLGSDSKPVPVSLLGQRTYLADSMQFALEYFLRIQDGLPGVYYVNTSFRGEDPDAMHLNQFNHVECEFHGDFYKGISVAESYIIHLVSSFLRDHEELVRSTAGSTSHVVALLEQHRSNGNEFPRISLDDALDLPSMDGRCWKQVVSDSDKGRALTRAGELKLVEHFGGAVWVTEMDHLGVPFYQAFMDDARKKASCADLLLGNGEVLGLGERHVLAEHVRAALDLHEVSAEKYAWYLEIRRQKSMLTTRATPPQ